MLICVACHAVHHPTCTLSPGLEECEQGRCGVCNFQGGLVFDAERCASLIKEVVLPKGWAETSGIGSLEGFLFKNGISTPQKVKLVFGRGPIQEDGPSLIMVPDFVPVRLVESVVHLCRQGYDITVEERFVEDK